MSGATTVRLRWSRGLWTVAAVIMLAAAGLGATVAGATTGSTADPGDTILNIP